MKKPIAFGDFCKNIETRMVKAPPCSIDARKQTLEFLRTDIYVHVAACAISNDAVVGQACLCDAADEIRQHADKMMTTVNAMEADQKCFDAEYKDWIKQLQVWSMRYCLDKGHDLYAFFGVLH